MTQESIETLTLKDLDPDTVTAWSRALGDPDWFRPGAWRRWPSWASWSGPTTARRPGASPTPSGPASIATLRPPTSGQATAEGPVLAAGHADAASGGDVAGTELHPAGLVATVDGQEPRRSWSPTWPPRA